MEQKCLLVSKKRNGIRVICSVEHDGDIIVLRTVDTKRAVYALNERGAKFFKRHGVYADIDYELKMIKDDRGE